MELRVGTGLLHDMAAGEVDLRAVPAECPYDFNSGLIRKMEIDDGDVELEAALHDLERLGSRNQAREEGEMLRNELAVSVLVLQGAAAVPADVRHRLDLSSSSQGASEPAMLPATGQRSMRRASR